ncbi:MAG: hypothetical protein KDD77_21600, partial [Caldilineaceae bacterium]|nr:hypothetical protein [Caldilineaceae bacterium]
GSLRQAIADVCAGGTVNFSLSYPTTITLTSGEIIIDKSLTIDGPGATNVAVSGNDASRIFYASGEVTIDGLTLRDGYASDGGAIYVTNWLTLTDSALISNTSTGPGGAIHVDSAIATVGNSSFADNHSTDSDGGAVANTGVSYLTVSGSTFTGNTALASGMDGGAIYSANDGGNVLIVEGSTFSGNRAFEGGAIRSRDYLYLSNSTFYNNEATNAAGGGGALRLMDTAYITNTTIYSNSAPGNGGGVRISSSTGTYSFANVIVAGNSNADCSTAGGAFDGATNLATDATCGANFAQAGDALLGTLGDYGGDTQTVPLLPGSPAIDAGDGATCLATDQRGIGRVGTCDIGAFE